MRRKTLTAAAAAMVLAVLLVVPGSALAQLDDTAAWASNLSNTYRVVPNVTYGTANNRENKVDLYLPRGADGPTPGADVHPRRRVGWWLEGIQRAAAAAVAGKGLGGGERSVPVGPGLVGAGGNRQRDSAPRFL